MKGMLDVMNKGLIKFYKVNLASVRVIFNKKLYREQMILFLRLKVYLVLLLLNLSLFSQEVIVNTNFAVRDFKIKDSTLVYIEKRDIKSFNLQTKKPDTLFKNNRFFIGGYGLNIFYPKDTNQIITASNELVRNVSSIRFYDLQKKEVNKYEVFYPTELMDFLISIEDKLLFLSKKDSTIEIFKYGGKPRYKKEVVIDLDAYARKVHYRDKTLYYITDSGKFFKFLKEQNKETLLYQGNDILVNFVLDSKNKFAFLTTIKGELIRVDLKSLESDTIRVSDAIIEAISILNDTTIVVGDWNGAIFIIDAKTLKIVEQQKVKKRILKIRFPGGNFYYTSSADNTIRKWKVKNTEMN